MTETTTAPFVLYRENYDYLAGRSRKILTHDGYASAGLFIGLVLAASGVMAATSPLWAEDNESPAAAVLVGLGFVVFGGWVLHRVRRLWRLAEEGTLLPGRVLSSTGADGDGGYLIRIEYHFAGPEGCAHRGKAHTFRDDLKGTLPSPGTPVHVLFLDERMYRPL